MVQIASAILLTACVVLAATIGNAAPSADTLAGRKPEATIDLATRGGLQLVKGEWRYSDTKIIEIDFKTAGPDGQPGDTPTKYPNTGVPGDRHLKRSDVIPSLRGIFGEAGLASSLAWQQTAPNTESRGFVSDVVHGRAGWLGPFAILVPFLLAGIHLRDQIIRGRRDREAREEQEWRRDVGARHDRPAWLQPDPTTDRTVRPDWMAKDDANPDSRPAWMTEGNRTPRS